MNAITGFSAFAMSGGQVAEVLSREGEDCLVLQDGREEAARRAFSCLVEPEPGDVVLVAQGAASPYILAVLERRGTAAMRLALPDGATVAADGGRLNLSAETLVMQAATTQVATQTLGVAATQTEARLGRVSAIAEAIETIATRIIGRFRRSYRFVEEGEHLRARDIDQRASGHMTLKGDTTTLQAGLVVKIDGAQIHMG
ncbi:DUF3540 domain-containing protein [Roseomonas fluvialis]|uniref:DUF3540 domain-containing protein n=1 Tax=Roseomonas fluvialis TaxID=1750527 RepID=A0ABN6P177_9PROT|nr:DUF3540 domain-containing protein [Roseomonas fluvialis]BDG72352.1 hypothetical protein Rmf_22810 [Roseomonas fluvialis]